MAVDDRAFISGNCLVHQFVRIGTLALMQGGAAISKDLPPYTVARGDNGICGLNTIGLRRAGFTADSGRSDDRGDGGELRGECDFCRLCSSFASSFWR